MKRLQDHLSNTLVLVAGLAVLWVLACGPAATPTPTPVLTATPTPSPTPTSTPTPTATPTPMPEPTPTSTATPTPKPTPFIPASQRNVSYGPYELQKLDVYNPGGLVDAPIVLLVHSGGFYSGDKGEAVLVSDFYNQLGFVVVAPNYRLSLLMGRMPSPSQSAMLVVRQHGRRRMLLLSEEMGTTCSLWGTLRAHI